MTQHLQLPIIQHALKNPQRQRGSEIMWKNIKRHTDISLFTLTVLSLGSCLPDPDIKLPVLKIPDIIVFDAAYKNGKPGYEKSPISCTGLNKALSKPYELVLVNPGEDYLMPKLMLCENGMFSFNERTYECQFENSCNTTGTNLFVQADTIELHGLCQLTVYFSTDEDPTVTSRRYYISYNEFPLTYCRDLLQNQ